MLLSKSLYKGCLKQKRSAQNECYKLFYPYVITVALHYVSNRVDAEEVSHTSFLKIFQKISSFKFGSNFKAWVRKIVVNSSIDFLRKNRKVRWLAIEKIDTEDKFVNNEALGVLEKGDHLKILQELPSNYRVVFNLFVLEGYTHFEISKMLGISQGTSKSTLFRSRQKLKKIIHHYFSNHDLKKYGY